MKLNIFVILLLFPFSLTVSFAQNVGIGTGSPAAKLDITSTNSGILIPRIALAGTNDMSTVPSPATSTMVYNTTAAGSGATAVVPGFYYWNGSAWVLLIDAGSLTGSTTNTLSLSGNTLTSDVNGVAPTQSLSGLTLTGDVTGTLGASTLAGIQGTGVAISSLATNNLLQYNGSNWVNVTPTSVLDAATTVSNTSSANTLSTTVNGVTGATVPIINSNSLSLSGTSLTSTINGSASNALDLSSIDNNIYNSDGTLTGNRTVTIGADNLTLSSSSGNLIFNPSSTGNVGIGTTSPGAPLEVDASSSSALSSGILNLFQANLPAGSTVYEKLGVGLSTDNEADLSFNYAGSGNTSNNLGIGFYGVSAVANFYANGNVKVNNLAGTGSRYVYADGNGILHTINGTNKATFSTVSTTATTWNVPSGVTVVFVKLWGAGGGGDIPGGGTGGGGGYISGWLSIPSGTTSLGILVGGAGGVSSNTGNDGGTGGTNGGGSTSYHGGGGGGRSTIQIGGTDYVTAGGGGGSAANCYCRGGGGGGGGVGLNGAPQAGGSGGVGASTTAVGASNGGGTAASGHNGGSVTRTNDSYGGGGGGGWFGGGYGGSGSGTGNDGGGGGGSSGGNSTYFVAVNAGTGQMWSPNIEPIGPMYPGGTFDSDYVSGVGVGGNPNTTSGVNSNTAGNGYVVIYW